MEGVKVALYGIGAIGSRIAKLVLKKRGLEIVGAIDIAEEKVGKDLGEVIGLERRLGVLVSRDAARVLSDGKPDVTLHSTASFLKQVYPQLLEVIKHKSHVISTCEELSFPYVSEPELARKLDEQAGENGVVVLGTGINPGFLMDTLVITLTGVCEEIESIEARRVMNAATRRVPFQKKIGAGLTVEEFEGKMESGAITGHVGLTQSIAMIADALGWGLDRIEAGPARPVIAEAPARSEAIAVEKGKVAGLRQEAKGFMAGREVIALDFRAYIGAEEEYDSITIRGKPAINQKISPCVHGDVGTISAVVNSIPKVMKAKPGLVTMKDLPVPSAILEDVARYL